MMMCHHDAQGLVGTTDQASFPWRLGTVTIRGRRGGELPSLGFPYTHEASGNPTLLSGQPGPGTTLC